MGGFSTGSDVLNRSAVESYISDQVTSTHSPVSNETACGTNSTNGTSPVPDYQIVLDHVNLACYLIICVFGLTGNGLVVYVVLMYAKMKTVTNMYILNLALCDIVFLVMLPITATTVIMKQWVFGLAMCKMYFVLYTINNFGVVFNLCVMSADRYLAVCHPIRSIKYRTPRIAFCICLCVWTLCSLAVLPFILYATTVESICIKGRFSCRVEWPKDQIQFPGEAFIWYSFILSFLIPVSFISIFYILVVVRLRQIAAAKKSKENKRSHGRVTRLIFAVVAAYVTCWLPYWSFHLYHAFNPHPTEDFSTLIFVLNAFTILSHINSMLNPILYAFLSDNFRQSFSKAFKCCAFLEESSAVNNERSTYPCTSQTFMRTGSSAFVEERVELSAVENSCVASPDRERICFQVQKDEHGFLKPPVRLSSTIAYRKVE